MEISLCMQATRTNTAYLMYVLQLSPDSPELQRKTDCFFFLQVLNKCDLLQAKLQRGVRIRDSVPSFGDRKNDVPTATRCMFFFFWIPPTPFTHSCLDFQQHFKEISKNHSPVQRPFYVHLTSVIVCLILNYF